MTLLYSIVFRSEENDERVKKYDVSALIARSTRARNDALPTVTTVWETTTVKVGFHYPSSRPELTGVKKCTRVLGPW